MVGEGVRRVEKKGDIAFVYSTMTSKSYAQARSGDKSKVSADVGRGTVLSKKWKRTKRWLKERIRELESRDEHRNPSGAINTSGYGERYGSASDL